MTARFMITNGGPHTPERWAMETAKDIFDISQAAGVRAIEAMKAQTAIAEALIPHHAGVQVRERALLTEGKRASIEHASDQDEALREAEGALMAVKTALAGTPWADYLDNPDRVVAIKNVIAGHLMTNKDIERRWHADRNPA